MTLNPIKAYRQMRSRREERRDARLRLQALKAAVATGSCMTAEVMQRSHTYFLYLKYGLSEDGVDTEEIFRRVDKDLARFNCPDKPLKL